MDLKPRKTKSKKGQIVYFEYKINDREIVIMRPTQFGEHQLPEPEIPQFIGNFWLIEEYTKDRFRSGQGINTIWYKDLDTAFEVLKLILDKNLDIPTKKSVEALALLEEGIKNFE